jgi:DNA-binding NarL/FixJ family response regulator
MRNRRKVLIVEPSWIVTEGLVKILEETPVLDVLSPLHEIECLNGRLVTGKPDILLLNPSLLLYSKRPILSNIIHEYPQMAVIALVYQYAEYATLRLFHGVIDICEERKHICEILLERFSSVADGDISEEISYELTKRETDVLVLIAKGFMNKEIADKLGISIHTVITHRKHITHKTNIKSVAGLAMYALMNNLVEEEGAL